MSVKEGGGRRGSLFHALGDVSPIVFPGDVLRESGESIGD